VQSGEVAADSAASTICRGRERREEEGGGGRREEEGV